MAATTHYTTAPLAATAASSFQGYEAQQVAAVPQTTTTIDEPVAVPPVTYAPEQAYEPALQQETSQVQQQPYAHPVVYEVPRAAIEYQVPRLAEQPRQQVVTYVQPSVQPQPAELVRQQVSYVQQAPQPTYEGTPPQLVYAQAGPQPPTYTFTAPLQTYDVQAPQTTFPAQARSISSQPMVAAPQQFAAPLASQMTFGPVPAPAQATTPTFYFAPTQGQQQPSTQGQLPTVPSMLAYPTIPMDQAPFTPPTTERVAQPAVPEAKKVSAKLATKAVKKRTCC